MQNIQRKYQQIAAKRTEIDEANPEGFVYITSDDNPDKNSVAGTTAHVTNTEAARQVVEHIAHLSTTAEVEAFVNKSRETVAKFADAAMRKNDLFPFVEALVGRAVAPAAPAAPAAPVKK